MAWKKGDILWGNRIKGQAEHPIIYIGAYDENNFLGCMLTSSTQKEYSDNVSLHQDHFEIKDENGRKHEIQYKNSFVVCYVFLKEERWGPFSINGRLTAEGIKFIEDIISDKTPLHFDDYNKSY